MPIYEYKCQSCNQILETIQGINDPLHTECPTCHGSLEKLISSTSFQLKGSGWYVTDFKSSDKKATNFEGDSQNEQSAKTDNKASQEVSAPSTNTSGKDE